MNTHGWAGLILRVDLTSGRIETQATADYVPDYIGGRGIATRIAWDEIPPGVDAFSPRNPLMLFTGPLTGTTAPFSGRTGVYGLGPQGYPHDWFTRAGFGGHWGPSLKYAGFDGIVVTGASDHPVYLWVHSGRAELRDARDLWGLGTYESQQRLIAAHGDDTRVAVTGPAGERLSRIAIINTETESAAGQGGFGAVMGAKRLKAIAVTGTGAIPIARPAEFYDVCRAIAAECHMPNRNRATDPERKRKYGEKPQACTQQCTGPMCARYYTHVPGVVCKGQVHAGQVHCVGGLFAGQGSKGFYQWSLGFEAGFEAGKLSNDYGLNHWDILLGIVPWLQQCRQEGLLTQIDGMPIDFEDPYFWAELLRKITYREGIGDALAEGGWRASRLLGVGTEIADTLYPGWGYAGHWDGHGDHANYIVFPFWLVSALQWAVDTRDPISSGHGYSQSVMRWCEFGQSPTPVSWDRMKAIGQHLYGNPTAIDPLGGYTARAEPAIWHGHRSILKDSAPVDDQMFPRIFSRLTDDGFARATLPSGRVMDGPDFEYHMLSAATGWDWSPADLDRGLERVANLDRALQIRNYGRSRTDDESIIPNLARPENWPNPLLGVPQALDPTAFRALMDEYYRLRGWDETTGHQTRQRLESLGLAPIADALERDVPVPA